MADNNYVTLHDVIMLVLGVLFPFVFNFIIIFPSIIKTLFSKEIVIGKWYSYHWSRKDHEKIFVKSTVIFYKSIFKRKILVISETMLDQNQVKLSYEGSATVEGDDMLFNLTNKENGESNFTRSLIPVAGDGKEKIYGIMIATDFNRKKYTTGRLLSRKFLTDEEAQNLLKNKYSISNEELCIRINSGTGQ